MEDCKLGRFWDVLGLTRHQKRHYSWWVFATHLKNMQPSNWVHLPQGFGMKMKNIWNHQVGQDFTPKSFWGNKYNTRMHVFLCAKGILGLDRWCQPPISFKTPWNCFINRGGGRYPMKIHFKLTMPWNSLDHPRGEWTCIAGMFLGPQK